MSALHLHYNTVTITPTLFLQIRDQKMDVNAPLFLKLLQVLIIYKVPVTTTTKMMLTTGQY